jgi:hypothetical protein
VAAPSPLTDREFRFLRELESSGVPVLLVGLAAAALQGAPVVTEDVDLWFGNLSDPRLHEALRRVGGAYVPPSELNPPMFASAGLELFNIVLRMDGLESFDEDLQQAVNVDVGGCVLKLLPLARILASKRAANRPKDRLVIPVLEDTLATITSRQGSAPLE